MQHDRPQKIPVVCVSSHQHTLEHIHDILRRRRLLTTSWSMLHFDSHADLACPGEHIPAACCFQPRREVHVGMETAQDDNDLDGDEGGSYKNLYELLDSTTSGIREFLPTLFGSLSVPLSGSETSVAESARQSSCSRIQFTSAFGYHARAGRKGWLLSTERLKVKVRITRLNSKVAALAAVVEGVHHIYNLYNF